MNKIAVALFCILLGVLLLLKNSNLLPDNFGTFYLELARQYWPTLIVLLGLELLLKEKSPYLGRIIFWIILLLLGLWLFCRMTVANSWVI
ncbi:MAG TPA: hypothetical protein DDW50_05810 [Firmicutes bacterium]|jgi:hypothetical protein|nr:hypothetical protein [Bacillota bacterium]